MTRVTFACSLVGVPLNLNNTAKYVELSVEGLRTRVRFPPAPPTIKKGYPLWVAFFIVFRGRKSIFVFKFKMDSYLHGNDGSICV